MVITPHIGGATYETLRHGGEMAAAEIERFARRRAAPATSPIRRAGRRRGERMSHLLAIDLGTGSCRAVLFDEDGTQVAIGQREWSHAGMPGRARIAGLRHRAQLAAHLRVHPRGAATGAAIGPADVAAVSSTSMREGMVLYDADGREIWACPNVDSRAGAEADRARPAAGGRGRSSSRAATGCRSPRPPASCGSRTHEPETFRRIAHVGMLSDWVLYRLTGRFVTDPSSGSSSDLFDLRARTWSQRVARPHRPLAGDRAGGPRAGHGRRAR